MKTYRVVSEPECFYSNCLLEAIRAKRRKPAVRWHWMPIRYNRSRWPHVLWEEDGYIYHFQCAAKGRTPWWKRFWFKGYLKRYNLSAWEKLLEKQRKRYEQEHRSAA